MPTVIRNAEETPSPPRPQTEHTPGAYTVVSQGN